MSCVDSSLHIDTNHVNVALALGPTQPRQLALMSRFGFTRPRFGIAAGGVGGSYSDPSYSKPLTLPDHRLACGSRRAVERRQRDGAGRARAQPAEKPAAQGPALPHPRCVPVSRPCDGARGLPDWARLGEAGRGRVPNCICPSTISRSAREPKHGARRPRPGRCWGCRRSGRRWSRSS